MEIAKEVLAEIQKKHYKDSKIVTQITKVKLIVDLSNVMI